MIKFETKKTQNLFSKFCFLFQYECIKLTRVEVTTNLMDHFNLMRRKHHHIVTNRSIVDNIALVPNSTFIELT